jgi:hypothetical protein
MMACGGIRRYFVAKGNTDLITTDRKEPQIAPYGDADEHRLHGFFILYLSVFIRFICAAIWRICD